MTLTNWEEDELENPVEYTAWVLNSPTNELTMLRTVKTAGGKYAPWNGLQEDIESAVLVDGVKSVCD